MSKNTEILSNELFSILSKYKILDFTHCLTRLRIKFDNNFPSIEEIKKIDGVLGVVQANDEMQIILGTSVVDDVYKCLSEKINNLSTNNNANQPNSANSNMTNFNKDKYRQNRFSQIMQKFAKIFSPLIPALVGAGIIGGTASIISIYGKNNAVAMQWYNFFQICLSAWSTGFLIIVGWRFLEIFGGGKQWVGGVMGAVFSPIANSAYNAMYSNGSFLGIHVSSIRWNWFTSGLAHVADPVKDPNTYIVGSPIGSMFGIILSCIAAIYILRFFERYIRGAAAFAINPVLTLLTLLFLNVFLIFPVSGYIVYGLSFIFQNVTVGWGAPFGCALLAGIFLLTLMFGVHTSFIPIYAILYKDGQGLNTIFPLLGMAGAAQVGAGFFLMLRSEKNGNFRKHVKGLLVSGILGIDEPLLFGVELPRIVPLVTCCIAAMIPGCYIGIMNLCHIDMGIKAVWGQNGIFGLLMTTSDSSSVWLGKLVYGSAWIMALVSGFFSMMLSYKIFKNNKKINWDLQ